MCLKLLKKLFRKKMTKDIRLFINGQEVEFKQAPAILYNWQETDFTNPTVTMNSYTANITVEGTPNNDQIFGSYWNLERYTTPGEGFNPSYRVPFTLYIDGDIYQKGYVKLQKVTVKGGVSTYEISLFGGLGQFLYNLSTDWNTGEKKSLADLHYYDGWSTGATSSTEVDLGFTIKKETVNEAWNNIFDEMDTGDGSKWAQINFAPCYNGLNDKMSNDKVIINFNGMVNTADFDTRVESGLTTYTPTQGFSLGTLPQSYNEWETKDLRCWAQRPVISAKAIIKAIQHRENNQGRYDSGYDVILDEEFFNDSNPYYKYAWMTLPMLSSLEFNNEAAETVHYDTHPWDSVYYTTAMGGRNDYTFVYNLPSAITEFGVSVKLEFDLNLNAPNASSAALYPSFAEVVETGEGGENLDARWSQSSAIGLQVYASDSNARGGNVLAATPIQWMSYKQNHNEVPLYSVNYNTAVSKGVYTPIDSSKSVVSYNGYFVRNESKYRWNNSFSLTLDLPVGTTSIKFNIQRCAFKSGSYSNAAAWVYQYAPTQRFPNGGPLYATDFESSTKTVMSFDTFDIDYPGSSNFFTGRQITKEQLLSTDFSPAEWLMNYCKMFGLYIHKDKAEDKIYIDTRKTFYRRNVVKNLEDKIDYSRDLNVSPIMVDAGYYSMKNESVEGGAYEDYMSRYGKEYGCKIIDTGYEFDANTKELIESPFKNAVQVRGNGAFYFRKSPTGGTSTRTTGALQPYFYNGLEYTLYNNGIVTSNAIIHRPFIRASITDNCQPFAAAYPYFDLFDKPEFCKSDGSPEDGSYVFLFSHPNYISVGGMGYMISDDLDIMAKLNNNPCWLYSDSDFRSGDSVNRIAIHISVMPKFSRYWRGVMYDRSTTDKSQFAFDWGSPRQLYVPEIYYTEDMTLYTQFYGSYLEDSYDINTKVLECFVKTDKVLNEDDLRNFYWFRNSLWRLNKVSDYDVTTHKPVKCQFVKVQNIDDMTSMIPDLRTKIIKVTPDESTIEWQGGTYGVTVTTNSGGGFEIPSYSPSLSFTGLTYVGPNISGKTTEGSFGVVFPRNDNDYARDFYIDVQTIDGTDPIRVVFTQTRANPHLEALISSISFGPSASAATFDIVGNVPWQIAAPIWATAMPSSGNGSSQVTVAVGDNAGAERTGFIYITSSEIETISIPITQETGANYIVKFLPAGIQDTTHNRWGTRWDIKFKYASDADYTTVSSGQNLSPHSAGESDSYAMDAYSQSFPMPSSAVGQTLEVSYLVNIIDVDNPDGAPYYSYQAYVDYYPGIPTEYNQLYTVAMPTIVDGQAHFPD